MSRVRRSLLHVRDPKPGSCPLCNRAWQAPESLEVFDGLVFWKGKEIPLQPQLYEILKFFIERMGTVLHYEAIFHHLYGHRIDGGPETRVIWTQVCKLRRILEAEGIPLEIMSIHGTGYITSEIEIANVRNNSPQRPKIVHSR